MGVSKLIPDGRPEGSTGGALGGSHEELKDVPDGCQILMGSQYKGFWKDPI